MKATVTTLKTTNQAQAAKKVASASPAKKTVSATAKKSEPVEKPKKFEPPILGGNVTPEFLADELGDAREQKAYWEKAEAFYKEALKARAGGAKSIFGDKFIVMIEEQSRTTLDSALVRNLLDEDQIAECERTTTFEKVTTKRR